MYLTAQRVTDPASGATGVNCFLHRHGRVIGVNESSGYGMLNEIANGDPGSLVAHEAEIPPGGNAVLSYLDVICEDSTAPEVVDDTLAKFESLVEKGKLWNKDGIIVFYSSTQSLSGKEVLEYPLLKTAILKLIHS